MKIIFWGTPDYSVHILKDLIESEHEILAVVTQPDRKRSRGSLNIPSPVKTIAIENNIKVITPTNIKLEINYQKEIEKLKADVFIVVAFGQILPKEILQMPALGCWNIHASLLPKWRGAAPIQRSILEGDKETGINIMLMDEGLDTGPIFTEHILKINYMDNATDLSQKLKKISSEAILLALTKINDTNHSNKEELFNALNLTEQQHIRREMSYAKMISKNEYHLDWNNSSEMIHRVVMAFYPLAYTCYKNKRIRITKAIPIKAANKDYLVEYLSPNQLQLASKFESEINGKVIQIIQNVGFIVSTLKGSILILEGQLEGKKKVTGNILVNQLALEGSEIFDGSTN